MALTDDYRHMGRALQLASRGLYTTDPNPRVGCVIVREDRIVGEGWHRRAGEPHAEILALKEAGADAAGATAYVSLEPCCHDGRTPPCSDALISAGLSRVVIAMSDPNPQVAGGGIGRLQSAGIDVESGILAETAAGLNPGFSQRHLEARPFVRIKLGATLDGRTAMGGGESQWITSAEARQDAQRLRARSSAILTGIGTALKDDPSLTVRLAEAGTEPRQPLRVVVDTDLRLPPAARMLSLPGDTLIMTACKDSARVAALEKAGAAIQHIQHADGGLDLRQIMANLAQREINEVLVEAGPSLCGSLVAADLVDEVVIYMAPSLIGDSGYGMFRLPGVSKLKDRLLLEIRSVRRVGEDLRISAAIKRGPA